ncbi:branched-chain amino acid aminotransferase [Candidatus Karelsulcia muelleri]|uniref:branched-chain amino acid aminotransferase n=1 Tax=Candidatus Karelsulcia muelleri TaxID=336810 RepID=UPI002363AA45|nr:branched-chain amino acid aminotransferase [Candidatus Karelsulcia muelleri]WDE42185.1 branched-chain amino acid aminotransferase [Candidatus Karelsulcia muelleri]WDR79032.1 branched-chain amino acid aminotransferase [Candidatus Karelsulcia muelleri]
MLIEKGKISRIKNINWDVEIPFGKYYTDHMLFCEYRNDLWKEPQIQTFGNFIFFPNTLVFHYGQAIFEGMKAFKDRKNNMFLFRPLEHFKRFNISAKRLAMPVIPKKIFVEGLINLLKLDTKWIVPKYGYSLYIRPFMIATDGTLTAKPSLNYLFFIFCTSVNKYYSRPLKVKIELKYSRSYNGGIGFIKAAGNYAASFFPTKKAQLEGFDQILWTDSATHSIIEESGTMNVFFYIQNTLITAPADEKILNGISRRSIIEFSKKNNINVIEKYLTIDELKYYLKKKEVAEIFGTGTAVVINHFEKINLKNKNYLLPILKKEERISYFLKKNLLDIQYNLNKDPYHWRFPIQ